MRAQGHLLANRTPKAYFVFMATVVDLMCCLANTELHFWHPRKLILFIWMQDVAFSVGEILHHLSNWDFSSLSSFFYVLTQQQSISILYKSFKTDELLLMWDLLVGKLFLKNA